jgi:hypothetical protein
VQDVIASSYIRVVKGEKCPENIMAHGTFVSYFNVIQDFVVFEVQYLWIICTPCVLTNTGVFVPYQLAPGHHWR